MHFVGGNTPYECGKLEKDLTPSFFTIGGQSCHISNVNNSKPEVEIQKLSTHFFTARGGLQSALLSFRTGAPQVGDIAKVPRPPKIWPQFSRPADSRFSSFSHMFDYYGTPCTMQSETAIASVKKYQGQKKWFFGFGGLTPKLKIWVPTAMGGLVEPLEGHLSPQKFRRYPQPFSRKLGLKIFLWTPLPQKWWGWGTNFWHPRVGLIEGYKLWKFRGDRSHGAGAIRLRSFVAIAPGQNGKKL